MTTAALLDTDLDKNPVQQFARWFEEAKQKQPQFAEAMTVSTASEGVVTSRMCLLKSFDEHGFVFFTNYNSRKGTQISENPRVALCFFWAGLERQVRVEGVAVKTTAEESDAYFATRPRGSQIGAWVSNQSKVIAGRGDLDQCFRDLEANYAGRPIPRPPPAAWWRRCRTPAA